jgi:hypothetical protein
MSDTRCPTCGYLRPTYTTNEGTGGFMPDKRMADERLAEFVRDREELGRGTPWGREELLDALIAERAEVERLLVKNAHDQHDAFCDLRDDRDKYKAMTEWALTHHTGYTGGLDDDPPNPVYVHREVQPHIVAARRAAAEEAVKRG